MAKLTAVSVHARGVFLDRMACSVPLLRATMFEPRMPHAVQTNRGSSWKILIPSGHLSTYSARNLMLCLQRYLPSVRSRSYKFTKLCF